MLFEITNVKCGLLILSIIVYLAVKTLLKTISFFRRPKDFPPGPSWYIPFVGNSRYLRNLSRKLGGQHKAFEAIARQFNTPVVGLKLGTKLFVVAMGYPTVKEIYSREEFDGRPDSFFLRLRTMGTRLGITCTDEKFWTEQRAFVVRQLKSIGYGRPVMKTRIYDEMSEILEILRQSNEQPVNLVENHLLATSVTNILWTFTTGAKIKRHDKRLSKLFELMETRSKVFDFSGGTLNQMPWLRFIAPESTGYNLIKDLNSIFYEFFMEIVAEHLETFSYAKANDDLIYAFIKEMKEREGDSQSTFTIKQLIMVILDIFIGGSQTTSTAIDLTLMSMLIYPDVQARCRQEIKAAVADNHGDLLSYDDRQKTPFTDATIMEVQRFLPFVVISGQRRALRDCKLANYTIPKDTTVLMGLGSALNDETVWKDPKTFNPERFLDENNKIINTDKFIPFGAGRRRCLGDQLAKECIYQFVVGILNEFSLHKCDGDLPSLDLMPGIFLSPKPYKIIFKKLKN